MLGTNNNINEIENLFEEFPKLKQFNSEFKTIAFLKNDARKEQDPEMIRNSYETILRLQERLHVQIFTFFSEEHSNQFERLYKLTEERAQICNQLKEQLQEERQANNDTLEQLCFSMIINPRYTFENIILKGVERNEKINSGDGYNNWQWRFHFPLMVRLQMAWKLAFGSKVISENSDI